MVSALVFLIGQMVLELLCFYPIKNQKEAPTTAAAASPHTGFSADDVEEGSLKCSAAVTVKMSTLAVRATLPRFSTNPTSRAKSFTLPSVSL